MNKENTEKKDEEANGLNEMRLIKKNCVQFRSLAVENRVTPDVSGKCF